MKYVVVSGGVVSGLGKGIASSSIGALLKACELNVTSIKIDPYLNTDAGTMSPYEHGEVFVLDDGGEGDLDLGNYERFLSIRLSKDHNITTGKVYQHVINKERKGDYLGKTVQVVPHITDAIQEWIERVAVVPVDASGRAPEVCMIELGGTVGDIESMVFLEALRQFRYRVGSDNFCHVHVSLVPVVGAVGEPKSKPTQHGVKELRAAGLSPDLILCRSSQPLDRSIISKISQFCMVPATHVVSVHDVSNIYRVPLLLLEQRVPGLVLGALKINRMAPAELPRWQRLADSVDNAAQQVRIGLIGKYTGLSDAYLSVTKALAHAALENDIKLEIEWIEASSLEEKHRTAHPDEYNKAWKLLHSVDGVLVPGGFGDRGVMGKMAAAQYAREKSVPYLGICLGMQVAVVEFARNVLGWQDANSTEFDEETTHPVVIFMPEGSTTHMGGTMRLGARTSNLKEGTLVKTMYGGHATIVERHRHRYEVNPDLVPKLEEKGLVFSGVDDEKVRMECIELPRESHPFFFAAQFHPEFKSTPMNPSPPFRAFVLASAENRKSKDKVALEQQEAKAEAGDSKKSKKKNRICSSCLAATASLSADLVNPSVLKKSASTDHTDEADDEAFSSDDEVSPRTPQ